MSSYWQANGNGRARLSPSHVIDEQPQMIAVLWKFRSLNDDHGSGSEPFDGLSGFLKTEALLVN